ncbi:MULTISPECIES: alpha/beta fold hydrolase [Alteromonadaceae]|uniref:alpha/beta fold hydrolase n=1 Tax=Alteromonadaceae TaxID=72275 RepID=UPI001C08B502|nr:alpha/beta hydrolase [Aliiglaciecola lipolytica]MBU2880181.1 alpha/beta hydrolase [Aliiglaciecola lipolytica]
MMLEITTPTIFFPGTLCDERIWIPLWKKLNLAQRSYVPLQWADTLEQMQALSSDRINSFEQKVHLVGFSMGGYIAALTALQFPDKVASLTLIGYCPDGLSAQEVQQRKMLIKMIDDKKSVTMNQARLAHFFTQTEMRNADLVEIVKDMESDLGPSVLKAHVQSTTPRPDLSPKLKTSTFPIHFIAAELDQVAPAQAIEDFANSLANADFNLINGTGHMMLLAEPDLIAKHLHKLLF